MISVWTHIPTKTLEKIDQLVRDKKYSTRTEVINSALNLFFMFKDLKRVEEALEKEAEFTELRNDWQYMNQHYQERLDEIDSLKKEISELQSQLSQADLINAVGQEDKPVPFYLQHKNKEG